MSARLLIGRLALASSGTRLVAGAERRKRIRDRLEPRRKGRAAITKPRSGTTATPATFPEPGRLGLCSKAAARSSFGDPSLIEPARTP